MTSVLVRIMAIGWALLSASSLIAGIHMLTAGRTDPVAALPRFLARVAPTSRWERITSRLLALLLIRSFFTESVNTSLWPWAVTAWVALTIQLLGLRQQLHGYTEIIERGFDRPITRYVAGHVALDIAILIPVIAIAVNGVV